MSTVIIVALAVAVALAVGFVLGRTRGERAVPPQETTPSLPPATSAKAVDTATSVTDATATSVTDATAKAMADATIVERARILRAFESEAAALRGAVAAREASAVQLGAFAEDRARLFAEVADARGETARYRQLLVDLEDSAPPHLLDSSAPDDLKLIVGIGPVLERLLHQLGIATYRQIARWNERDIDDFDAKLPEFRGRIRRDSWVTQARSLHQSKYGETIAARERW